MTILAILLPRMPLTQVEGDGFVLRLSMLLMVDEPASDPFSAVSEVSERDYRSRGRVYPMNRSAKIERSTGCNWIDRGW